MFTLPKGMRDISAEEMAKREYVFARIKGVFVRYGFRLVEPSALENLETLTAKSGPDLEKEIYAFEDKSKRKIGLRFDLTVGMARFVANNEMPRPIRLACISNMWRYDNPQYTRYRSFWQWDAEIYGCAGPEADAEIISLICDILGAFGLEFEIRISNRKLIEGFLLGVGVEKKKLMDVLRVIDKKSKVSEKELSEEFKKCGLNAKQIKKVLQFSVITSLEKAKAALPKNELALQGFDEMDSLFALLNAYGKSKKCRLDLSIVRGIDYYTGIVYEAWIKNDGKQNDAEGVQTLGAVAGGGRYDDLLDIYGKAMPATGVAGGIERLLLSLEKTGLLPEENKRQFFLAYATPDVFSDAVKIMNKARASGLPIIMDLNKRDLRKQFEYANRINARYVIVVGQKELAAGKLRLRDMKNGEEKEISLDNLFSESCHLIFKRPARRFF